MKRTLFLLLAALLILAAAVPALAMGRGDSLRGKGGVWCYTPTADVVFNISDYDGEKVFMSTTEIGDWTGVFEGTSADYGVVVFPNAEVPPTLFTGTVVFDEVEVDGVTGGLEMDVVGSRRDPFGNWYGTWNITSASGELEGLNGYGIWWGPGWLGDPNECGVIHYRVRRMGY